MGNTCDVLKGLIETIRNILKEKNAKMMREKENKLTSSVLPSFRFLLVHQMDGVDLTNDDQP